MENLYEIHVDSFKYSGMIFNIIKKSSQNVQYHVTELLRWSVSFDTEQFYDPLYNYTDSMQIRNFFL